jgi:hypothetical protein
MNRIYSRALLDPNPKALAKPSDLLALQNKNQQKQIHKKTKEEIERYRQRMQSIINPSDDYHDDSSYKPKFRRQASSLLELPRAINNQAK